MSSKRLRGFGLTSSDDYYWGWGGPPVGDLKLRVKLGDNGLGPWPWGRGKEFI